MTHSFVTNIRIINIFYLFAFRLQEMRIKGQLAWGQEAEAWALGGVGLQAACLNR